MELGLIANGSLSPAILHECSTVEEHLSPPRVLKHNCCPYVRVPWRSEIGTISTAIGRSKA
eukprot:13573157-Alexandrium_andersonii.AAC.1